MREQVVRVRELKKSASNNYLKEFEMREIQKQPEVFRRFSEPMGAAVGARYTRKKPGRPMVKPDHCVKVKIF